HGKGFHEDADAEPCAAGPTLSRTADRAAAPFPSGKPNRRNPFADRPAPLGRLCRDQSDRGARRDRRQLGTVDTRAQHRGDSCPYQSRSSGGNRAAASVARPCWPDRDRLHRYGGAPQSDSGRAAAEGGAKERSCPHSGWPNQPVGLLEMSRQRLRPSLVETSTQPCPHCGGTGFIRSTESTALYVLRSIEEEGMRRRSAEISVAVPTAVALYIDRK